MEQPATRSTSLPPSSLIVRISGPLVSRRIASGLPVASITLRKFAIRERLPGPLLPDARGRVLRLPVDQGLHRQDLRRWAQDRERRGFRQCALGGKQRRRGLRRGLRAFTEFPHQLRYIGRGPDRGLRPDQGLLRRAVIRRNGRGRLAND